MCDKRIFELQKRMKTLETKPAAPKYGFMVLSLIVLGHQVAYQRLLRRGSWLPILAGVGLVLLAQPSSPAAMPTPVVDVSPDPIFFDGGRFIYIDLNQQPMTAWSIVAVVRPTVIDGNRTVVTNDRGGWNDDVLFGISPETSDYSPLERWAAIHQNNDDHWRTVAFAAPGVEVNTWYHIAATSDGEYLRFYVNGRPVSCPTQRYGTDLTFATDGPTYIGGRPNDTTGDPVRCFEGFIYSVQLYNATLTDTEIQTLAAAESLLDFSNFRLRCHVDNIVVGGYHSDPEGIQVQAVTSMDIVNGNEVVTDLHNSRFVYRTLGVSTWQAAPELIGIPLLGQHSITWSDSVLPPRYFVADTDNGRIVSFESLSDPNIYSEADTIYSGREPNEPIDLSRPHDLEFNPQDGYFYGVTAPTSEMPDTLPKVLFRFKDIKEDGTVIEGGTLDLGGTNDNGLFYMRSVTIVNGVVYAVNSRGLMDHRPEVIRIDDFDREQTTVYRAASSFTADLQGIEFHNGWWYGTGDCLKVDIQERWPLLCRWRSWADFEAGSWEDLSYLIYPNENSTVVSDSVAYFLTRWSGRLFFTVYHADYTNLQDRVYEIVAPLCFSCCDRGLAGDLNCDGEVNLLDLRILAKHWLESASPE